MGQEEIILRHTLIIGLIYLICTTFACIFLNTSIDLYMRHYSGIVVAITLFLVIYVNQVPKINIKNKFLENVDDIDLYLWVIMVAPMVIYFILFRIL